MRENFSRITQQNANDQFCCTLSAGITQLIPGDSIDRMISAADTALYEAKKGEKQGLYKVKRPTGLKTRPAITKSIGLT